MTEVIVLGNRRNPTAEAAAGAVRYSCLRSLDAWRQYRQDVKEELSRRREYEASLIRENSFAVDGRCYPCGTRARFRVGYDYAYVLDGRITPNWREQLRCPSCYLNSRMRASAHLGELLLRPQSNDALLLPEESTPLCRWFSSRYSAVVGFEFLGDELPFGQRNSRGIRNETLMGLTFGNAAFDYVLSFEVFEHVPDHLQAFKECFRVLKPGGRLLFSVPFDPSQPANLIRARSTDSGEIEHLLPAEYHGDPMNRKGCLAFRRFGWEMLDQVKESGFSDVAAYFYWSRLFCYLGDTQTMFIATK